MESEFRSQDDENPKDPVTFRNSNIIDVDYLTTLTRNINRKLGGNRQNESQSSIEDLDIYSTSDPFKIENLQVQAPDINLKKRGTCEQPSKDGGNFADKQHRRNFQKGCSKITDKSCHNNYQKKDVGSRFTLEKDVKGFDYFQEVMDDESLLDEQLIPNVDRNEKTKSYILPDDGFYALNKLKTVAQLSDEKLSSNSGALDDDEFSFAPNVDGGSDIKEKLGKIPSSVYRLFVGRFMDPVTESNTNLIYSRVIKKANRTKHITGKNIGKAWTGQARKSMSLTKAAPVLKNKAKTKSLIKSKPNIKPTFNHDVIRTVHSKNGTFYRNEKITPIKSAEKFYYPNGTSILASTLVRKANFSVTKLLNIMDTSNAKPDIRKPARSPVKGYRKKQKVINRGKIPSTTEPNILYKLIDFIGIKQNVDVGGKEKSPIGKRPDNKLLKSLNAVDDKLQKKSGLKLKESSDDDENTFSSTAISYGLTQEPPVLPTAEDNVYFIQSETVPENETTQSQETGESASNLLITEGFNLEPVTALSEVIKTDSFPEEYSLTELLLAATSLPVISLSTTTQVGTSAVQPEVSTTQETLMVSEESGNNKTTPVLMEQSTERIEHLDLENIEYVDAIDIDNISSNIDNISSNIDNNSSNIENENVLFASTETDEETYDTSTAGEADLELEMDSDDTLLSEKILDKNIDVEISEVEVVSSTSSHLAKVMPSTWTPLQVQHESLEVTPLDFTSEKILPSSLDLLEEMHSPSDLQEEKLPSTSSDFWEITLSNLSSDDTGGIESTLDSWEATEFSQPQLNKDAELMNNILAANISQMTDIINDVDIEYSSTAAPFNPPVTELNSIETPFSNTISDYTELSSTKEYALPEQTFNSDSSNAAFYLTTVGEDIAISGASASSLVKLDVEGLFAGDTSSDSKFMISTGVSTSRSLFANLTKSYSQSHNKSRVVLSGDARDDRGATAELAFKKNTNSSDTLNAVKSPQTDHLPMLNTVPINNTANLGSYMIRPGNPPFSVDSFSPQGFQNAGSMGILPPFSPFSNRSVGFDPSNFFPYSFPQNNPFAPGYQIENNPANLYYFNMMKGQPMYPPLFPYGDALAQTALKNITPFQFPPAFNFMNPNLFNSNNPFYQPAMMLNYSSGVNPKVLPYNVFPNINVVPDDVNQLNQSISPPISNFNTLINNSTSNLNNRLSEYSMPLADLNRQLSTAKLISSTTQQPRTSSRKAAEALTSFAHLNVTAQDAATADNYITTVASSKLSTNFTENLLPEIEAKNVTPSETKKDNLAEQVTTIPSLGVFSETDNIVQVSSLPLPGDLLKSEDSLDKVSSAVAATEEFTIETTGTSNDKTLSTTEQSDLSSLKVDTDNNLESKDKEVISVLSSTTSQVSEETETSLSDTMLSQEPVSQNFTDTFAFSTSGTFLTSSQSLDLREPFEKSTENYQGTSNLKNVVSAVVNTLTVKPNISDTSKESENLSSQLDALTEEEREDTLAMDVTLPYHIAPFDEEKDPFSERTESLPSSQMNFTFDDWNIFPLIMVESDSTKPKLVNYDNDTLSYDYLDDNLEDNNLVLQKQEWVHNKGNNRRLLGSKKISTGGSYREDDSSSFKGFNYRHPNRRLKDGPKINSFGSNTERTTASDTMTRSRLRVPLVLSEDMETVWTLAHFVELSAQNESLSDQDVTYYIYDGSSPLTAKKEIVLVNGSVVFQGDLIKEAGYSYAKFLKIINNRADVSVKSEPNIASRELLNVTLLLRPVVSDFKDVRTATPFQFDTCVYMTKGENGLTYYPDCFGESPQKNDKILIERILLPSRPIVANDALEYDDDQSEIDALPESIESKSVLNTKSNAQNRHLSNPLGKNTLEASTIAIDTTNVPDYFNQEVEAFPTIETDNSQSIKVPPDYQESSVSSSPTYYSDDDEYLISSTSVPSQTHSIVFPGFFFRDENIDLDQFNTSVSSDINEEYSPSTVQSPYNRFEEKPATEGIPARTKFLMFTEKPKPPRPHTTENPFTFDKDGLFATTFFKQGFFDHLPRFPSRPSVSFDENGDDVGPTTPFAWKRIRVNGNQRKRPTGYQSGRGSGTEEESLGKGYNFKNYHFRGSHKKRPFADNLPINVHGKSHKKLKDAAHGKEFSRKNHRKPGSHKKYHANNAGSFSEFKNGFKTESSDENQNTDNLDEEADQLTTPEASNDDESDYEFANMKDDHEPKVPVNYQGRILNDEKLFDSMTTKVRKIHPATRASPILQLKDRDSEALIEVFSTTSGHKGDDESHLSLPEIGRHHDLPVPNILKVKWHKVAPNRNRFHHRNYLEEFQCAPLVGKPAKPTRRSKYIKNLYRSRHTPQRPPIEGSTQALKQIKKIDPLEAED